MHVLTADYCLPNAAEIFTQSLIHTGFAVVKNHPIDIGLVLGVYREWETFFASEDKNSYIFERNTQNGCQDGYFPINIAETAKGHNVKDLKEFFQIYLWGRYPSSVSQQARMLYREMTNLAGTLLHWIELYTPRDIRSRFSMPLSAMIKDSPRSMLRILHYPPFQGNEPVEAVRAAPHEDINLLTLLPCATAPGLQVKDIEGNWHDVPCEPNTIVVNTGDMLQMCSERFYKSTTHRVINPIGEAANKSRLSMPLFLHPNAEVALSKTHTSESYLFERLRELGVA